MDVDKSTRLSRWEQDSTDAWFAAAKEQWRGPRSRPPTAEAPHEREAGEGAALVGAEVEVDLPSFRKAAEGHTVFAVKVRNLTTGDGWTTERRYTEFVALRAKLQRGLRDSRMPSDLRSLGRFPAKALRPDLEQRRRQLLAWLQDAVAKVALHVCDATASHATAAFLGLRSGTFIAHGDEAEHEQASPAPAPIAAGGLRRVQAPAQRLAGSPGSFVMLDPAEAQRVISPPQQPGTSPARPSRAEPRPPSSLAPPRAPSASAVLDARPEATTADKLAEASSLHREGLISASDLEFAQATAMEPILADAARPAIERMRDLKALHASGLLVDKAFAAAKRRVLLGPGG